MWNCVEDRVENGAKFGRIVRKLIFEDLYIDRESVLCRVPVEKATLTDLKVKMIILKKIIIIIINAGWRSRCVSR